jgi:acylglycerol lipase
MTQSDDTVNINGNLSAVHKWNVDPTKTPRALVVVYHGFLAHGNYPTVRYAAEFLAEANYAVVALDFAGHGKSEGLRGYLPTAESVIADGVAMAEYAKSLYHNENNLKLFLVGSSMGGAIALSVAQKMGDSISGVVLLAPMLKLNVSSIEHSLLQGLAFLMPTVQLIPSSATSSEKQYRDEKKREECDKDELTVSGAKLRVGSALTCVDIATNIGNQFESISSNYLLLVADEDVVVKNQGSSDLFEKSPSKDKTMKRYPALHGLLCEPSPLFDEIKGDMLAWLEKRT